MRNETNEGIEISDRPDPDASIIWLHGLGADGNDFVDLIPMLGLPERASVRFVFPHAEEIPVTINGGMTMRGWYDIRALPIDRDPDESGIRRSGKRVLALVQRELDRGIDHRRVLLAGFSQGGAIALHAGLRCPVRLAGIMALSACLHLADSAATERHLANRDTPIFVSHGRYDDVVPFELGRQAVATLTDLGYKVAWSEYPMAHSLHPAQIDAIGRWIVALLWSGSDDSGPDGRERDA